MNSTQGQLINHNKILQNALLVKNIYFLHSS